MNFIRDFIATVLLYGLGHLLLWKFHTKPVSQRAHKVFTVCYAVAVYVALTFVYNFVGVESSTPNMAAAFLWSVVFYRLGVKRLLRDNNSSSTKQKGNYKRVVVVVIAILVALAAMWSKSQNSELEKASTAENMQPSASVESVAVPKENVEDEPASDLYDDPLWQAALEKARESDAATGTESYGTSIKNHEMGDDGNTLYKS